MKKQIGLIEINNIDLVCVFLRKRAERNTHVKKLSNPLNDNLFIIRVLFLVSWLRANDPLFLARSHVHANCYYYFFYVFMRYCDMLLLQIANLFIALSIYSLDGSNWSIR